MLSLHCLVISRKHVESGIGVRSVNVYSINQFVKILLINKSESSPLSEF